MGAMASQITSHTIVYSIQAQVKENSKAPRRWPLRGQFIGHRWILRTIGQQRGKCFHCMTSSWKSSVHKGSRWVQLCMFIVCILHDGRIFLYISSPRFCAPWPIDVDRNHQRSSTGLGQIYGANILAQQKKTNSNNCSVSKPGLVIFRSTRKRFVLGQMLIYFICTNQMASV